MKRRVREQWGSGGEVKTFPPRNCVRCGKPLSVYNPKDYCNSHDVVQDDFPRSAELSFYARSGRFAERVVSKEAAPVASRSAEKKAVQDPRAVINVSELFDIGCMLKAVARACGVSVADIRGPSHASAAARARHLAMYTLWKDLGCTPEAIGLDLNRSRVTVLDRCHWIESTIRLGLPWFSADLEKIRAEYKKLREMLSQ